MIETLLNDHKMEEQEGHQFLDTKKEWEPLSGLEVKELVRQEIQMSEDQLFRLWRTLVMHLHTLGKFPFSDEGEAQDTLWEGLPVFIRGKMGIDPELFRDDLLSRLKNGEIEIEPAMILVECLNREISWTFAELTSLKSALASLGKRYQESVMPLLEHAVPIDHQIVSRLRQIMATVSMIISRARGKLADALVS